MMQRLLAGYRRCWLAIASRPSTMASCAPSSTPAPWPTTTAAAAAAAARPAAVRWPDLHGKRAPHRQPHLACRQQQLWTPDRAPVLGLPALAPLRVPPCPFTHRHSSPGLRPPSPDAERAAQHLQWQHTHSSAYAPSSPSSTDHHQQQQQQQDGGVQGAGAGSSTAPTPGCPEAEALQRPWRPVVAACAAAALLCYLTRANISTAIVPMSADMHWDKATSANVLSSFFAGYSLTQVLGGHLADRLGGAPVLAAGVAVWSLCAALGPAAAELGVPAMLATRFGLGVAQGVAFPAIHALLARHVPPSRHSASTGMIMGAAYTGTVLAFGACPPVISAIGWQSTFYMAGAAALLWVPQWLHMTRQTAAAEAAAAAAAARAGRPPAGPQGRSSSSSSSSSSSMPGPWSQGPCAAGVSGPPHGRHLQQPSIELHRSAQQQQEAPPPTWLHWRPLPDTQRGDSSGSGTHPRLVDGAEAWQPGGRQGQKHAVPQPNWLLQHQHPHLWGSRVLRRRHRPADPAGGYWQGVPLEGGSSSGAAAVGPVWNPVGVTLGGQQLQQHGWASAAAADGYGQYSSSASQHVISSRNGSILEAAGEPAILAACTSTSSSNTVGVAGGHSAASQPSFDRATSSTHAAATISGTAQPPGDVAVGVWPLMRRKEVWAIAIAQYTSAWGFYGLLAWLPTFFMEHCGVSLGTLGGYTVGPYVLQALVGASAGLLADRLINQQRWRVRDVRVAMQVAGMLGPALCMTAAASPAGAASPLLAASLLTLGMGASALTCSGVSVSHLDIAPRHAGVIFGLGNTASTLAGLVAVPALGYVVQHLGSWGLAFGLAAAHNMVGAVLWARWAGDRPLPEDGPQCMSSRGVAAGGAQGSGKGARAWGRHQAAGEQAGVEPVGGQADSGTDNSGWRWDSTSMRLRPASP